MKDRKSFLVQWIWSSHSLWNIIVFLESLAHESFCIKPQNLGHLDTNIWVISPYKGQADAHSMALEVLLCDVVPCVKAPGYHYSLPGNGIRARNTVLTMFTQWR